ncbi:MAG: hypothetical protein QF858_00820 [Candidatus Pacebacteria bacterium]|jgi:hypothetical protein|nr:hypothetical protein [bacterium]MDP6527408.1 hypothetical protein [Candidatus Paceibacterota bacterium]MDP6659534.1 hypothetical protein [Candidatus Paceibacterota bacterium]|tara:strand:- start:17044 stop:17370 length:327 start_codon:yes stop_codon:yes gene_type:complete
MNEKELQNRIMRRVVSMYYLKKVINPVMLKLYALAAVAAFMTSIVSVKSVIANMPGLFEVNSLVYFSKYALTHTELSVQLSIALAGVVAVLLVKDSLSKITHSRELVV